MTNAKTDLSPSQACEQVQKILTEKNAQDIVTIDLKGKSALADYMIIASGNNKTHLNALANHVNMFAKQHGMKSKGIEGAADSAWVVLDIGDIILHLFLPETRDIYDLENMWSNPIPPTAKKIEKTK